MRITPWPFIALALTSAARAEPLSLAEAVRLATERSPQIDAARNAKEIASLQFSNAKAALAPSADATATHGLSDESPRTGANPTAPWASSYALTLTENLYDNGVSLTNLAITRKAAALADLQYAQARDQQALAVALEYYQYSLDATLVDIRANQQKLLEKQFQILSEEYHQGIKTRKDYLRFEAQVKRGELDLMQARTDSENAAAELRRLVGTDASRGFAPVEAMKVPLESTAPPPAPTLATTYELRASDLQKSINEESVTLSQRLYWPQLNLTGDLKYQDANYLNSGGPTYSQPALSWDALVTLNYNLWDWGTRRRNVAIAELTRDQNADRLNQGLLDTQAKIDEAMANLGLSIESFRSSRELLTLEEKSYRYVEADYRDGKVAYLDLVTSLSDLLDARVRADTAYFSWLESQANVRYFQGNLYDWILTR